MAICGYEFEDEFVCMQAKDHEHRGIPHLRPEDGAKYWEWMWNIRNWVYNQPCKCTYEGDGDWFICGRCYALGAADTPI